jgi:hypothetical protein
LPVPIMISRAFSCVSPEHSYLENDPKVGCDSLSYKAQ